ncbi:hypothetical protein, partial [Nonomuraea sp. LPB2021202275-12-8]|uniref:hypothetical protein n=1 Tax=Nonomuraea sp. LPB2021202275-12-8 TaxID=3120159 RepID=UPI00300D01F1
MIKAYKGGCIVWHIRPVFILNENDPIVTKTASHIAAALYKPEPPSPRLATGRRRRYPARSNGGRRGAPMV